MLQPPTYRARASVWPVVIAAVIAFVTGILLTLGFTSVQRWLINDTRPIGISDIIASDEERFAGVVSDAEACGDRPGCKEGAVGDGVAVYRFRSVDVARQFAAYSAEGRDFYRSDQFILEFDGTMTETEEYSLIQVMESIATSSDAE